jgi:2',3'-cyclic-nucleotide 2'-phosphodiesterase (5'-nucleotidase family)
VAGKTKAAVSGARKFTILHTNDEHSEIIPYDLAMDYPNKPTTGGFSRLAKAIKDIKAAKAAAGEPVLTLGAGDWSQGTLFSWLETTAAPELTLMQRMGYDAVAIGNHEVELGPQYLAAELNAAKAAGVNLPVLNANITFSGNPPDPSSPDSALYGFFSQTDKHRSSLYIQPYTTKTLSNGLKVGMFGLLGVDAEAVAPGAAPLSFGNVKGDPTDPISFVNRVITAQNTVGTLRNTEHCDVVVCVSHLGTYEEEQLADFVPNIDVIIGGHSHDLDYPPIIRGRGNTIIVEAKANSEYLGDLELKYDPAATTGPKVTVRNANAIHMGQSVGTIPALDTIIRSYLAGINAHLGFNCLSPFAETDLRKDGGFPLLDEPPLTETNLGDLITDTYKTAVNQVDPAHPTRIVVESNGVIRTGLAKGAKGVFSFYDLYRSLPLGGSPYDPTTPGYPIVAFYLTGAEIHGVLNQLLEMNLNDFFVQVSGLKYTYDPNAASGKKVISVTVDNGAGVFEPINPAGLYRLATNYYTGSFLATFGLFPRDATGAQHKPPTFPDPMKEFIVHTGPTAELKAWQAFTSVVGHMPDLDGDHLPNVPRAYYSSQGRITRLATAFYFAEGTCRPGFDPYICIQNPGSKDAGVKITYMKGDGSVNTQEIFVPAHSRFTVHPPDVLGRGDDAAHDFSAKVECTNGQQIMAERPMYFNYKGIWTGGHDVVGVTSPASTFYFAEGTCRPNFDPYICIQNPGGTDASVNITYMKGDGATASDSFTVAKNSRFTVNVKDKLGEGDDAAHDFSAKVECPNGEQIIVERPMYFNYKGEWTGGSDVVGSTSPASAFYFAEGTCRTGFDPYFCIQNTDSADASVKITYMKGDGTTDTQTLTVAKSSRATVVVRDKLGVGDDPAHDFSAKVEALNNVPIVAERPMYFNYKGEWTGGSDVVGATSPASTFSFAEGTCRPGFEPYLTIQNPGTVDASVKITYMKGDGTTDTQTLTVAKNSRSTVNVKDKLGVGDDPAHDFSARIECTNSRQIICERPMYFNYKGWTGGSCVVGFEP